MWPSRRAPPDETPHLCPLCQKTAPAREAAELYGHLVCGACHRGFVNRRAAAWLFDRTLFAGGAMGALTFLEPRDPAAAQAAFIVIGWLAFALRDGHRGRSPGKALCGLQVVTDDRGEPIDALRSLARNAILFIPFVPLLAALQISRGKRIGDGLARTKVVWTRYARSRVFG